MILLAVLAVSWLFSDPEDISYEVSESIYPDTKGPVNLERNSKSRDYVWDEPIHKPSLFRPRY